MFFNRASIVKSVGNGDLKLWLWEWFFSIVGNSSAVQHTYGWMHSSVALYVCLSFSIMLASIPAFRSWRMLRQISNFEHIYFSWHQESILIFTTIKWPLRGNQQRLCFPKSQTIPFTDLVLNWQSKWNHSGVADVPLRFFWTFFTSLFQIQFQNPS